MTTGQRCNFDAGFLHHSYISSNGIDVYRCTAEDSFNEAGRYFIMTVSGPIEVLPQKVGKRWTYEFVDTERRRLSEEAKRIEEELDARQALYRNNMKYVESRQKFLESAEKEVEDDD